MANNNHFYFPFEKSGSFDYSPESINNLTEYEKYQLSFHPERPKYLDYLSVFDHVEECQKSDAFGSCLIQTHRAEFKGIKLMLIGQQSGPSSNYKKIRESMRDTFILEKWNHGMATPASYERAVNAAKLADEENRIVVTFLDTPGADPTEAAEEGGIAWRIGNIIQALAETKRPTLSIIINRGCSGGAIALTGCDVVLAMENSTYLVISPEAASSILFHTRQEANHAAEAMWITSKEGEKVGIVDELISEDSGPAHKFPDEAKQALASSLEKWLPQLDQISNEDVFEKRIDRWEKIGHWDEMTAKEISSFTSNKSRIPTSEKSGFIQRHKACRNAAGKRIFDPQQYESLLENDFVCPDCLRRYTRLSAWDYIHYALDKDSFTEHEETKYLVDKDILGFPDYQEKLKNTQIKTGLASAMITGNGTIKGQPVVFCGTDFGFLGGSYCMSTAEKIWRASEIALNKNVPMILQAAGGGARMHEGCSSMVGIPKAHVALTKVERAGLKVITLITDPTLGGVAIGYASRGIRLFEEHAGNIGFSGKRVIEQYTGHTTSRDFQMTEWLKEKGHVEKTFKLKTLRETLIKLIDSS
ncbi:MAG: acetyl-CoA carboxylase carboxyl transferase subunit alpha/beta [Candidatus Marinimicrobia bacterium]|nr:acetyl-CoA carboxylase carboxyl transferase subunit alpha/beta [Candidatus Neomarinimicrobiota bacterium]